MGILQRDGAPVAQEQLRVLVEVLRFVGPDAQSTWISGPIGFGHTLLQTDPAGPAATSNFFEPSADPADAYLRITADVHLDSRSELRSRLTAAGREISPACSDAQLVLHAYGAWGANCVEYLRGDFAFAIWDASSQTLFCARDHFGIKPFYYAIFDSLFLFSNALRVLHRHPNVSGTLNESAIADFLLFGLNCNNATTTFRDIQRLPPAHSLIVRADNVTLRRYWEVPTAGRIRYTRGADYVENFLAVWKPAVADRLDANPTGLLLSGGLDSAAVAATAKEVAQTKSNLALRAFTIAHQELSQDHDPQFATALAQSLGIPQQILSNENLEPFEHWDDWAPISPEPVDDPLFASLPLSFQRIAAECRVLLSGEGADNLMHFEMWPYAEDLARRREWPTLLDVLARFAWRRPFPWRGLRVRLQGLFGRGETVPVPFPKWIATDFAARHDLPARWREGQPMQAISPRHPEHPAAHASLYLPQWTRMFELENSSVTKCPVEVRYPFLDLRVVEYLLAIPPFPWSFQKSILRQAMAGRVLDSVRLRPKTAFVGDPLLEQLRRRNPFGTNRASKGLRGVSETRDAELSQYINASLLSPLHAKMTTAQVSQNARPFCLNFWLQSIR